MPMCNPRALPDWRSILYVPVNVARFVERAPHSGADAIQLDLEDSIAPEAKDEARALVGGVARRLAAAGAQVLVRLNRPLAMAVRDIEAAVGPDVSALSITKTASPDHVRLLAEVVSEREERLGLTHGHTRLLAMIETPQAFEAMREIASASPRMIAMSLGAEDFALECGFAVSEDALRLPKQMMVINLHPPEAGANRQPRLWRIGRRGRPGTALGGRRHPPARGRPRGISVRRPDGGRTAAGAGTAGPRASRGLRSDHLSHRGHRHATKT